jgi:hypothetical protein
MKMSHLDENQVASVNQLLQLCRKKIATNCSIKFYYLSNIQFLPDVDNKMKRIDCFGIEESNIPILIKFFASPRADGQQRVIHIDFLLGVARQKFLDAIKEVFEDPYIASHMCFSFFYCKFITGIPYINPTTATTIFPPIPNICEYSSK